jgi:hypothetical protein
MKKKKTIGKDNKFDEQHFKRGRRNVEIDGESFLVTVSPTGTFSLSFYYDHFFYAYVNHRCHHL